MEIINESFSEEAVRIAIAKGLEDFYRSLIQKIDSINITEIMRAKNPYLYRAKSMQTSAEIIDSILQAFVSSSEETMFGNCFFEPVAIAASGGEKSDTIGIDMDIRIPSSNSRYLFAIKSGTSAFNGDSKNKQEDNFRTAMRTSRTSRGNINIKAIIAYAYGTKEESGRGSAKIYEEVAGEEFWEAITGDKDFYTKIISYMDTLPEQYIDTFKESYAKASNRLVRDFTTAFCDEEGNIDWVKLVEFNSGSPARKRKEKLISNATLIFDCIKTNPKISIAKIEETVNLRNSAVKKALSWLIENGFVSKGYAGRKTGWTINKDMESQ